MEAFPKMLVYRKFSALQVKESLKTNVMFISHCYCTLFQE